MIPHVRYVIGNAGERVRESLSLMNIENDDFVKNKPGRTSRLYRDASPLLSVIVPVYQTVDFVLDALNSLIPEDRSLIEMIVVHDGGSDGSLEVCRHWIESQNVAACLIDQPNMGLSAARNEGVLLARGRYLSFLDSDDLIDVTVLVQMVRDAEALDLDIVFARSMVLDNATLNVTPFYDCVVWDDMLAGRNFLQVSADVEPNLLLLEPNANTRLYRRSFYEQAELQFPLGRTYEDIPMHVKGILKARKIGLRNEILFFYRINRFGKITSERSDRRFDVIFTASDAISHGVDLGVNSAAGGCILRGILRLVNWCGSNVTNERRPEFVEQACATMKKIPDAWFVSAILAATTQSRERRVLMRYFHGDVDFVADKLAGTTPSLHAWFRYLTSANLLSVRRKLILRCSKRLAASVVRKILSKTSG